MWGEPEIRAALAVRDMGVVYRALVARGVSQSRIAALVGQSQSDVSEIIAGRVVQSYGLLERIAEGLGVPRELMGLSWYGLDGSSVYPGSTTTAEPPEGVDENMRRRHLLATAGIALIGEPIKNLGELLEEPPRPSPVPMPSRVQGAHVAKVRDLTRSLREASNTYGSDPEVSSAAAAWATRLLDVSAPDQVKHDLKAAVALLHLHAGWAAFDAVLPDRTIYHYTRGLELATDVGDTYLQALGLAFAGLATQEHGHPDDGLKMMQFSQVKAWDIPRDHDGRDAVQAMALAHSATALAQLGYPDAAMRELAKARALSRPSSHYGDPDRVAALLETGRGRLDAAEPFATASLRRWERGSTGELGRTHSSVVLATIHVRAGDRDGLGLAHGAISRAGKLSSMRARKRLQPLADTLDTRPGSDHRDLARMARQVAATRV